MYFVQTHCISGLKIRIQDEKELVLRKKILIEKEGIPYYAILKKPNSDFLLLKTQLLTTKISIIAFSLFLRFEEMVYLSIQFSVHLIFSQL